MKTFPLSPRAITALAGALVCLPLLLAGAEKTPPSTSPVGKAPGYDLQVVNGQLLRSEGKAEVEATLPNVVDALRDQYTDANIILSPNLAKLRVGDLKLRAGRLAEELEGIRVACGERFEIQATIPGAKTTIDPTTGQQVTTDINAGLYVLREAKPPRSRRIVEAFNIRPYLDWVRRASSAAGQKTQSEEQNPDQIQVMVLNTLEAFNGNSDEHPVFQYHPGAAVLVVIGDVDSVEIARKIVNALPGMTAMTEESKARYNAESGRFSTSGDNAHKQAEDAFRARFGLTPRPGPASQPAPESGDAK